MITVVSGIGTVSVSKTITGVKLKNFVVGVNPDNKVSIVSNIAGVITTTKRIDAESLAILTAPLDGYKTDTEVNAIELQKPFDEVQRRIEIIATLFK